MIKVNFGHVELKGKAPVLSAEAVGMVETLFESFDANIKNEELRESVKYATAHVIIDAVKKFVDIEELNKKETAIGIIEAMTAVERNITEE